MSQNLRRFLVLKRIVFTALSMSFTFIAYGQELEPASRWSTIAFSEYTVFPNITYKKANGRDIKLDVIRTGNPSQVRPTVVISMGAAGWGDQRRITYFSCCPIYPEG